MRIHFLKTVWSDIIILEDHGHFAMIDTGTADQFPQIMAYLADLGAKKLDFILLTHFHPDHYGCIPALLDALPVEKVILKEYSGLECVTASGKPADDLYRQSETEKFLAIREKAMQKSRFLPAEGMDTLDFAGHTLRLYNTENSIRSIYEDPSCPETFHRCTLGENQNSMAILLEAEGTSVFLGGDIQDLPSPHPLADHCHTRVARMIGRHVDLYKAPHHGTVHTAAPEAIAIYRPEYVVITNGAEYLRGHSDVLTLLAPVAPRVYLTENNTVIMTLEDGRVIPAEGCLPL